MFWKIFHYFQGISFSFSWLNNSFSVFVVDKTVLNPFSAVRHRIKCDVRQVAVNYICPRSRICYLQFWTNAETILLGWEAGDNLNPVIHEVERLARKSFWSIENQVVFTKDFFKLSLSMSISISTSIEF